MAAFHRVVITMLICCVKLYDCQTSRITLNPTTLTLTPNTTNAGGSVDVTCQFISSGVRPLGLNIKRVLHGSAITTLLVSADAVNNDGKPTLPNPIPGGSATGSMAENSIKLSMTRAKCNDAGLYICIGSYTSPSAGFTEVESTANLTVDVSPGALSVTALPPNKQNWNVNETLTLTCEGPVGTVDDNSNTQVVWVWEYRDSSAGMMATWSPYDGPSSDITAGSTTNPSCYQRQTSILKRSLILQDNNRMYRCYVRRRGQSYQQFAASHFVGSVTVSGGTGTSTGTGDPSKANIGPIVGGVLGGLIVIAVIILVIYFLVIRPRRQGNDEKDGEDFPEKLNSVDAALPPDSSDRQHGRQPKDKRWEERDRGKGENINMDGLHYADLDLIRNPRGNSGGPRAPEPTVNGTEYASIRTGVTNTAMDVTDDNDDKRRGRRGHKDREPRDKMANPYDNQPPREGRHGRSRPRDEEENLPPYESRPARQDRPRHNPYDEPSQEDDDRQKADKPPRSDREPGRRNRDYDNRNRSYSSDDGGMDSNISFNSVGRGNPNLGTAI